MGLFIDLLIDPARIAFMAFLLATALELKSRIAVGLTITLGAIVFAVLMPLVRPTEAPGIALGLIANLFLLAIFYRFHTLVLRRLNPGSNRPSTGLLMGLFDLLRSRKARREQALLAEARARGQNLAMLRSAISTIGGEMIAAGSDTQLAPRSAALLVSHIITPRSVVDSDVRLLAGLFAMVAARHFSSKIGTNFEYASTHAVLEVIGLRNRDEIATIIENYNKPCVTNADPVAMVGYSVGVWMACPTQENLGFLRGLFSLLFGWMAKERGSAPQQPSPALQAGAIPEAGSAPPPDTKPYRRGARLVDWDGCPAIFGEAGAFAMLKPNSLWVPVDFVDVQWSGDILPEEIWRKRFKRFGELDPPMFDQVLPRAQEPTGRPAAEPSASAPPSPALPAGAAGESASAASPDTEPYKRRTLLVDWDRRPAIIGERGAFAMLSPNSYWVEVDFVDVWWNADVLPEEIWRARFKSFGELDPPMIDQLSPPGPLDPIVGPPDPDRRSPGIQIWYPKPETP